MTDTQGGGAGHEASTPGGCDPAGLRGPDDRRLEAESQERCGGKHGSEDEERKRGSI